MTTKSDKILSDTSTLIHDAQTDLVQLLGNRLSSLNEDELRALEFGDVQVLSDMIEQMQLIVAGAVFKSAVSASETAGMKHKQVSLESIDRQTMEARLKVLDRYATKED